MKLTPWFAASIKPVHVGVYQTRHFNVIGYSYWGGKYWSYPSAHNLGVFNTRSSSQFQDKEWRGLSNPPKGAK